MAQKKGPTTDKPSMARSHILERNLAMLGSREDEAGNPFALRRRDGVTCAAGEQFYGLHAVWFEAGY
jgi:hypothetical protein